MLAPDSHETLAEESEYPGADEAFREFSEATPTVEIPFETMQELVYPQGAA